MTKINPGRVPENKLENHLNRFVTIPPKIPEEKNPQGITRKIKAVLLSKFRISLKGNAVKSLPEQLFEKLVLEKC